MRGFRGAGFPMVDADAIRELHRQARHMLDQREASVAGREAEATRVLAECAAERKEIEQDRSALGAAEQVYARLALIPSQPQPISASDTVVAEHPTRPLSTAGMGGMVGPAGGQKRARIGPQRYLILAALREHDRLLADLIWKSTGLAVKRVREQLAADESVGIVLRHGTS